MSIAASELARPTVMLSVALQAELRRRARAKSYQSLVLDPNHPLHSLLDKDLRYIVYYGGRGAVKSWGIADALIRRANSEPIRWLCTREYQNSIRDSVHQLLRDTVDRMGLNHRFYITDKAIRNHNTGSHFIFKGLHQNVDEIKSTEGLDGAWVEEAQSTSENSWQTLIPTVRKEKSQIIVSFNVTDEEAPTYKRFVPIENRPPNSAVHRISYKDNPFFPEVLRREMEFLKRVDYQAYLHVWEGEPKKISDAIIFGKKVRVESFPDDLWRQAQRPLYGADFGFSQDPSTLVRSFILENKLYIEYEAYGVGVELNEMEGFYVNSVPESKKWPIKADNARPETISYLRGLGFSISAADKWKGSVEDGIAHLKAFDEIIVHERCKHAAQEARLYAYKVDRVTGEVLPIIVDKHNHIWDAVRYSLDGYIQRRGDLGIWARL